MSVTHAERTLKGNNAIASRVQQGDKYHDSLTKMESFRRLNRPRDNRLNSIMTSRISNFVHNQAPKVR